MGVRKLMIDSKIQARLGSRERADLRANLWAIDCQTCGRPLGSETPALAVESEGRVAMATLHHRQCRQPSWSDLPRQAWQGAPYLSWRTATFVMPPGNLPVFVVNPSCESAMLRSTGAGWRIANLDAFVAAGMSLDMTFKPTARVPGLVASLGQSALSVHLAVDADGPGFSWSCSGMTSAVVSAIDSFAGLLVGVTTRLDPGAGLSSKQVGALIADRKLAMGIATVHFAPEIQGLRYSDFEDDIRAEIFALLYEMIRRRLGIELDKKLIKAALACCGGDNRWIASLTGRDKIFALLLVAALYALPHKVGKSGKAPAGEGTHVVLPDERNVEHVLGLFRPVLTSLETTSVDRIPAYGSDVLLGTPEQFVAAWSTNRYGRLAIVVGTDLDRLPSDVLRPYRRVLAV